jgi:threonylcarbamoyladenosine tRNA methylthiotransferase MtaB
LRAEGDRQFGKLLSARIGMIESVLVEHDGLGRSEQFVPVAVPGIAPGEIVPVRIEKAGADGLVGAVVRSAA